MKIVLDATQIGPAARRAIVRWPARFVLACLGIGFATGAATGFHVFTATSAAWFQAVGSLVAVWAVFAVAQQAEERNARQAIADHNDLIFSYLEICRLARMAIKRPINERGRRGAAAVWKTCGKSIERLQFVPTRDAKIVLWSEQLLSLIQDSDEAILDHNSDINGDRIESIEKMLEDLESVILLRIHD